MIIGEQPAHFRYVWNQTQYYGTTNAGYFSRSAVNQGMTSLLASDLGDGWAEAGAGMHYFQLYAVSGPKVTYGHYRWDTSETMTQLAQRKGWTVLAGPRPAHFTNFTTTGNFNWEHRFRSLQMVTDPARVGWGDAQTLVTETACTDNATHEIMLVAVINSADQIQAYRPMMVLPFATARNLPAGSELRVNHVQLDNNYMYYDNVTLWRDMYYRGYQ